MMTIGRLYPFATEASEGTVLGLIAVAAFGLTLPLTRIAVPFFGPLGVTAARAALGGLAALAILVVQRAPLPSPAQRRELVVVALVSVPAALLSVRHVVVAPTVAAYAAMLYLGLVSQLGGFFLWNRALAVGGIARASQTQLLQPFFTIGAAALFAGEAVHGDLVAFAVVVALSVALGRSRSPLLPTEPLALTRKNES
jgi:drug/metabolite transporter (DMT)-like permease